jgi:uncharacterized membrane protein
MIINGTKTVIHRPILPVCQLWHRHCCERQFKREDRLKEGVANQKSQFKFSLRIEDDLDEERKIEISKSIIAHEVPAGWSYNPSGWSQRLPIVGLALIGFGIAAYLALYQWRVFAVVWEPLFGNGSRTILNSSVSQILPIPDAALGALGYLADAITGIVGRRARWRSMPWIVIIFGLAVGPLGLVSVLLVILQPVMFEAWCTLCLASALVSVLMIGPAADEVLASLQYLKRERLQGHSLWRAFWGISNQ